jgi:hypothetical protein
VALINLLLLAVFAVIGLFTPGEGGGDPPADPPAPKPGDPPADPPGPKPADPPAPKPGDPPAPPAPAPQAGTSLEDVQKLQRELNEARTQAAGYRNAGIQALAKALGIDLPKGKGEEGQEAALAQLQTEITTLRDEARGGKIDAGLERVFTKLSVNPRVARPYIERQLKDLDPKADDFTTKLEQIVQAAIDEEPALKAAQAARRSGGEFNGNGAASSGETEDPTKLAAVVPRG